MIVVFKTGRSPSINRAGGDSFSPAHADQTAVDESRRRLIVSDNNYQI
jgi:hypothetical protein